MSDDRRQPDLHDAELDELLSLARWPEPDARAERRLRQFWISLQNKQPRSTVWRIAAAVLLAPGCWIVATAIMHRPSPLAVRHEPITTPTIVPAPQDRPPTVGGRPPTALERSLSRLPRRFENWRRPSTPDGRIEAAVKWIEQDDSPPAMADARDMIAGIEPRYVQSRLARMTDSRSSHVRPAARLLASIATPSSIPTLLALQARADTRAIASDALARVAGPATLATAARNETDPVRRRRLIGALLTRDGDSVVPLYLGLVADPNLSAPALAAIREAPDAPTDRLIDALSDPHVPVRESAARALAQVDDPVAVARLIEMVRGNVSRREALLALAESRSPAARRFVRTAVTGSSLSPFVRAAVNESRTIPSHG